MNFLKIIKSFLTRLNVCCCIGAIMVITVTNVTMKIKDVIIKIVEGQFRRLTPKFKDYCYNFNSKTNNQTIMNYQKYTICEYQSIALRIFEELSKENSIFIINIFFCPITQNIIINVTDIINYKIIFWFFCLKNINTPFFFSIFKKVTLKIR